MLIGKYVFVIFLSLFVMRNFRGTCSSVEMLKGYIARESLGIPALDSGISCIVETQQERFQGYLMCLVTAHLLNHNHFLFLQRWC